MTFKYTNTESDFTIYGRTKCDYCRKIKAFLNGKDIEYVYIDIVNHDPKIGSEAEVSEYLANTGAKKIPVVFMRGKYLGCHSEGFDKLKSIISENTNNI